MLGREMEQERIDELTEMRFRHFERFSGAMIESQQEMLRTLTQNTKQLVRLEKRVDKIETRMDGLETRMDGLGTRMDGLDMRMERIEGQVANLAELVTLALDDLAFIKNHLNRGE